MKVAILMLYEGIGGAEIRTLKVLRFFPKENYILIMPKNKKLTLIRNIKKYLDDKESLDIVQTAYELEDFYIKHHINYVNSAYYFAYGRYIGKISKKLNVDLLYSIDHYNTGLWLGIRSSRIKWSMLFQQYQQ